MAIVIPSKKIYKIENDKFIDNAINKIEVTENNVEFDYQTAPDQFTEPVELYEFGTTEFITEEQEKSFEQASDFNSWIGTAKVTLVSYTTQYTIKRYPINKDYYIEDIKPTINYKWRQTGFMFFGRIDGGSQEIVFDFDTTHRPLEEASYPEINSNVSIKNESVITTVDEETGELLTEYKGGIYYNISFTNNKIDVKFSRKFAEGSTRNLNDETLSFEFSDYPYSIKKIGETKDEFTIEVSVPYAIRISFAQGFTSIGTQIIDCYRLEMYPQEAVITYNEETRKLKSESVTNVFTNEFSEGEYVYSFESSQFIRPLNTFLSSGKEQSATERSVRETLSHYYKGKETAKILCSIGEYYDTQNKLAISAKTSRKMVFEHYDYVIPYFKNAEGIDEPLSKNIDGTPKIFEVVGVKEIFDGIVWQELTLREWYYEEMPMLIQFTVDSSSFTAKQGMTWEQWVESEYNTASFYVKGDFISIENAPENHFILKENVYKVQKTEIISSATAYSLGYSSSGYTLEPNTYGYTVIIDNYSTEINNNGTTVIIE